MPCCVLISEQECQARHAELDQELKDLFDEVFKVTGTRYYSQKYIFKSGLFRKKITTRYDLVTKEHPDSDYSFQLINFGPEELEDSSIGHLVSRQTIAAYLFGALNGFRAGQQKFGGGDGA